MPELVRIADFSRAFSGLVGSISRTNRRLALAEWSRMRRRSIALRHTYAVRSATLRTRVFLQKVGQEVFFFFVRGPKAEEVVLDLRLNFEVMPSVKDAAPKSSGPLIATMKLPSFLVEPPSSDEQTVLAKALGEKNFSKIVFLKPGLFRMGIILLEDSRRMQLASMLHDSAEAGIAYIQLTDDRFSINFSAFLVLLEAVEDWARSGFQEGSAIPIGRSIGGGVSKRALPKIIRAMLDGRTAAYQAAIDSSNADPFDTLRPALDIRNYHGEVILRLRADGEIAEKIKDDDFRLRVSVAVENEGGAPAATLVAAPPDFLTGGDIHDRMIEILREKRNLDVLFDGSGLAKSERARFEQFISDAAPRALVFRALKNGDRDSELLSFRGDWDGFKRRIVVSAIFIVKHTPTGIEIKLEQDGASLKVVYCDLSSSNPKLQPELPQYLLRLIGQLRNWQLALQ